MFYPKLSQFTLYIILATLAFSLPLAAEDKPSVNWSAADIAGAAVKVPTEGKPSIILFVLHDQPQSQQALELVKAADKGNAQVIVIFSGKEGEPAARKLAADGKLAAAFVIDPEYAASGKLNVHAWPTTIIVRGDGQQVAHLAGASKSLAKELDAYLAYAAGKIDATTTQQRIDEQVNVVDSPQQMASRHLSVAQRLIEKGMAEQAKVELSQGLKLQPDNPTIQLTMAEVLLSTDDPAGAMKSLDALDNHGISTWRTKLLRGRALVGLGKWDDAKTALESAVQLNPDPSVAYYELGRVYQHQAQWEQAAQAYRRAFETTTPGRKVAETQPRVAPTTRP